MREFPPFRLDTVNQCLWHGDGAAEERILLAPKAFAVLHYLVAHAPRLVTPAELLQAVWADAHVNEGLLRSYMRGKRSTPRLSSCCSEHTSWIRNR